MQKRNVEVRAADTFLQLMRSQPIPTNDTYNPNSPLLIRRITVKNDVKRREKQADGDSGFHSGADEGNLRFPRSGPLLLFVARSLPQQRLVPVQNGTAPKLGQAALCVYETA
jgi:hypothetical protein